MTHLTTRLDWGLGCGFWTCKVVDNKEGDGEWMIGGDVNVAIGCDVTTLLGEDGKVIAIVGDGVVSSCFASIVMINFFVDILRMIFNVLFWTTKMLNT